MNKRFKSSNKQGINSGVIVFLILVVIFFVRVILILGEERERGGFAYVQLLNFGMPIVEEQVYNEEAYAENDLSIKNLCLEALGVKNISGVGIINSEISLFNQGHSTIAGEKPPIAFNPFNLEEGSINKIETKAGPAYNPSLKKTLDNSKPEVLIYHSHSREAYANAGNIDSMDESNSVIGVGNALEKELEEKYGISVLHDKTDHSVVYDDSYSRSRETVTKQLQKYGDFKLIIDLHRDSSSNENAVKMNINGESAARLMFVTSQNVATYGSNKKIVDFMVDKSNELFPGLFRQTLEYKRGRGGFNQDLSGNSILLEFGSVINSVEECNNTVEYMGRLIAEYINTK
ncbi:MAG: stage II sporulation protein P [Clostridium sp.]